MQTRSSTKCDRRLGDDWGKRLHLEVKLDRRARRTPGAGSRACTDSGQRQEGIGGIAAAAASRQRQGTPTAQPKLRSRRNSLNVFFPAVGSRIYRAVYTGFGHEAANALDYPKRQKKIQRADQWPPCPLLFCSASFLSSFRERKMVRHRRRADDGRKTATCPSAVGGWGSQ